EPACVARVSGRLYGNLTHAVACRTRRRDRGGRGGCGLGVAAVDRLVYQSVLFSAFFVQPRVARGQYTGSLGGVRADRGRVDPRGDGALGNRSDSWTRDSRGDRGDHD